MESLFYQNLKIKEIILVEFKTFNFDKIIRGMTNLVLADFSSNKLNLSKILIQLRLHCKNLETLVLKNIEATDSMGSDKQLFNLFSDKPLTF
jgi:hypothetical protein